MWGMMSNTLKMKVEALNARIMSYAKQFYLPGGGIARAIICVQTVTCHLVVGGSIRGRECWISVMLNVRSVWKVIGGFRIQDVTTWCVLTVFGDVCMVKMKKWIRMKKWMKVLSF